MSIEPARTYRVPGRHQIVDVHVDAHVTLDGCERCGNRTAFDHHRTAADVARGDSVRICWGCDDDPDDTPMVASRYALFLGGGTTSSAYLYPPTYRDAVEFARGHGIVGTTATRNALREAARSVQTLTGLAYTQAREVVVAGRDDLIPHGLLTVDADVHPVLAADTPTGTWAGWIRAVIEGHLACDPDELEVLDAAVFVLLAQSDIPLTVQPRFGVRMGNGQAAYLDVERLGVVADSLGRVWPLTVWGANPNPMTIARQFADVCGYTLDIRPFTSDQQTSAPGDGTQTDPVATAARGLTEARDQLKGALTAAMFSELAMQVAGVGAAHGADLHLAAAEMVWDEQYDDGTPVSPTIGVTLTGRDADKMAVAVDEVLEESSASVGAGMFKAYEDEFVRGHTPHRLVLERPA